MIRRLMQVALVATGLMGSALAQSSAQGPAPSQGPAQAPAQKAFVSEDLASRAVRLEGALKAEGSAAASGRTAQQLRRDGEALLLRGLAQNALASFTAAIAVEPANPANWSAYARAALAIDPGTDYDLRYKLQERRATAAYQAYQKAQSPPTRPPPWLSWARSTRPRNPGGRPSTPMRRASRRGTIPTSAPPTRRCGRNTVFASPTSRSIPIRPRPAPASSSPIRWPQKPTSRPTWRCRAPPMPPSPRRARSFAWMA